MFDSIKHWFESLEQNSHLFNHPEEAAIHAALASVLVHIINCDHQESGREFDYFSSILKQEFELNDEQIRHLHDSAQAAKSDLSSDLQTINHYLKDSPVIRMRFMEKLNRLIAVDGVLDPEMDTFYDALQVIFPDIEVR
jgi:uncharacterized tellurite resistance protein B-like protein